MSEISYNTFCAVYREELARLVEERPSAYAYGIERVTEVADKICAAIKNGSFSHDGLAFRATCKRLQIKYTRKAILEYVNS